MRDSAEKGLKDEGTTLVLFSEIELACYTYFPYPNKLLIGSSELELLT